MCDTLNVAPGNRWDVIVEATEPGVWAFHCHILSHAEGADGHVRHGHGADRGVSHAYTRRCSIA